MVDFKHGKICYMVLPSQDPERSGAFYRDVFGWSLRTNGEDGLSFDDWSGVGYMGERQTTRERAQS